MKAIEKKEGSLIQLMFPSLEKTQSYSATIELYDLLPKYFQTQEQKTKVEVIKKNFEYRKQEYSLSISPALILTKSGESKALYPTGREEILEEVLKKIAIEEEGNIRLGEEKRARVVVKTTLYRIYRELKKVGHELNYSQIKESINVCSAVKLDVKSESGKQVVLTSSIFPTIAYEDKESKEGTNKIIIEFHPLISKSLIEDSYTLLNYEKVMKYKKGLSRFLHKRISHFFLQADTNTRYRIKLSTIIRDSGIKKYKQIGDNIINIKKSLQEMIKFGTLCRYEETKIFDKERKNKIVDVLFSLWLSEEFCNDIKKGNYHKSKNISNLEPINKQKLISTELISNLLKKELNSPEYNLPTGYIETYLLKNTTQEQIDNSLLSIKAAKEYILKLEQEKKVASSSKARIIKKALSEGWKPETQETVEENHKTDTIPEDRAKWHVSNKPEHQESFDKFLKLLKDRVGEATYDSWFKINLESIESEEIVLQTKNEFYSQELTNKYESIITEISLKIFNKKFCRIKP